MVDPASPFIPREHEGLWLEDESWMCVDERRRLRSGVFDQAVDNYGDVAPVAVIRHV